MPAIEKPPADLSAPEPRRIGERLWRSAPLLDLPTCEFFPRTEYASVALSSADIIYLLGGGRGTSHMNDVWLARLLPEAGTWTWTQVSPHEGGRREGMEGQVSRSKWAGRSRLGAAAATPKAGSRAPKGLYVTGGQGFGFTGNAPEDFWASEDGGATWYCMCRKVPWGARLDPGLAVVPLRYERIVFLGGMSPSSYGMHPNNDAWITDDAGTTWHQLRTPDLEPRSLPVLFWAPPSAQHGRVLLVLGGCRQVEESAGDRAGVAKSKYIDDAWAADIDFATRMSHWREVGGVSPEEAEDDRRGFDAHAAAFEPNALKRGGYEDAWQRPGGLVLLRGGRTYTASPQAPHGWVASGLFDRSSKVQPACEINRKIVQVALAQGPRAACPRFFVFGEAGVSGTGVGELARQRRILERLGRALEASARGFPWALWRARVMPCILPQPARTSGVARPKAVAPA